MISSCGSPNSNSAPASQAGAKGTTGDPNDPNDPNNPTGPGPAPINPFAENYPEILYDYGDDAHKFKFKMDSGQHTVYYVITGDEYIPKDIPLNELVKGAMEDSSANITQQVLASGVLNNVGTSEVVHSISLPRTNLYRIHYAGESSSNAWSSVHRQLVPAEDSPFITRKNKWDCGFTRTIPQAPSGATPVFLGTPGFIKAQAVSSTSIKIIYMPNPNWACDVSTKTNRFTNSRYTFNMMVRVQPVLGGGRIREINMNGRREYTITGLSPDTGYRITYGPQGITPGGAVTVPSDIPEPIEISTLGE